MQPICLGHSTSLNRKPNRISAIVDWRLSLSPLDTCLFVAGLKGQTWLESWIIRVRRTLKRMRVASYRGSWRKIFCNINYHVFYLYTYSTFDKIFVHWIFINQVTEVMMLPVYTSCSKCMCVCVERFHLKGSQKAHSLWSPLKWSQGAYHPWPLILFQRKVKQVGKWLPAPSKAQLHGLRKADFNRAPNWCVARKPISLLSACSFLKPECVLLYISLDSHFPLAGSER